jgi:hypothetical protein
MLILSGSAHPLHDSLSQPCPGHKRKNGLTSRLYPRVSRVLDTAAHPRDKVLGSRTDAFSTQFTEFSICQPMYDDKHMLKVVQHATTSALNNQEATATASYSSQTGWRTAPTLFTKPVCLHYFWKEKACYMPLLYQQTIHHPCQKQHEAS